MFLLMFQAMFCFKSLLLAASGTVNRVSCMHEVKKSRHADGRLLAEVISLSRIIRSCHLVPRLDHDLETATDPGNSLDTYDLFSVNDFLDLHVYLIL